MSKKPTIALPPKAPVTATEFVQAGNPAPVKPEKAPTKRLTIDVDADLHYAFKLASLQAGQDMKDVMTTLIQGYVSGKR